VKFFLLSLARHDDDDYGNELSQKHGQNYFCAMCEGEKGEEDEKKQKHLVAQYRFLEFSVVDISS
jgi:hypothetical protein